MGDARELLQQFSKELSETSTLEDLHGLEIKYLGRNGAINKLLQNIADILPGKRKEYGQSVNEVKNQVTSQLSDKKNHLLTNADVSEQIDVTLPGKQYEKGSLHMVTYAVEEISRIFEKLGFIRMSYPEVEWEYFSFEALNMPPGHPARDDFETFFIDAHENKKLGRMLLTPHTSSGQIREMQRVHGQPPIRMINIAKTYRPNWDATHTPMFHQFEGLCIDKNITIANLKGTIDYFAKEFFGEERQTRLRPFHFQFTEPSFEVDITCDICGGKGMIDGVKCKVCKSGWLELGGAGMVHPNVLKAGSVKRGYTGWAFGIGIERVMMMKEGFKLNDLRIIYDGDIRFLEQF